MKNTAASTKHVANRAWRGTVGEHVCIKYKHFGNICLWYLLVVWEELLTKHTAAPPKHVANAAWCGTGGEHVCIKYKHFGSILAVVVQGS